MYDFTPDLSDPVSSSLSSAAMIFVAAVNHVPTVLTSILFFSHLTALNVYHEPQKPMPVPHVVLKVR